MGTVVQIHHSMKEPILLQLLLSWHLVFGSILAEVSPTPAKVEEHNSYSWIKEIPLWPQDMYSWSPSSRNSLIPGKRFSSKEDIYRARPGYWNILNPGMDMDDWLPSSEFSLVPGKRSDLVWVDWSPNSWMSRVPGKRSKQPIVDLSAWSPTSQYSLIPGKRQHEGIDLSVWAPYSKNSLIPGKKSAETMTELPWEFNMRAPMLRGKKSYSLQDETNEEKLIQILSLLFESHRRGKKKTGRATALPWGMNLQSPMMRGKKAQATEEII